MRAGVYVALEVKRIQSILWMYNMARFSESKQQRIVSLWHDDHKEFATKQP